MYTSTMLIVTIRIEDHFGIRSNSHIYKLALSPRIQVVDPLLRQDSLHPCGYGAIQQSHRP